MDYRMEELVPIVGRLAEEHTGHESTSVTYEIAEQLMKAVLYCIQEAEQSASKEAPDGRDLQSQRHRQQDIFQVYKAGCACVEEKTKRAMDIYHEMLPRFCAYGNQCLYDDIIKGMPEFFKWYDIKFAPQNTVLTLDYPVLRDISRLEGIDKVYEFLDCVRLEQKFLEEFLESYVTTILEKCNDSYDEMIENICEIVFTVVTAHVLVKKPLSEQDFSEEEYAQMQKMFSGAELPDIRKILFDAANIFLQKYDENHGDREELSEYLLGTIDSMAVRLKNAANHGGLYWIIS